MYFILNVYYIPFIPLSSKSSTFFQIFRGRNGRNEFLPPVRKKVISSGRNSTLSYTDLYSVILFSIFCVLYYYKCYSHIRGHFYLFIVIIIINFFYYFLVMVFFLLIYIVYYYNICALFTVLLHTCICNALTFLC